MALDRSKLVELENSKVVNVSYTDEYEDVISYNFIFRDSKIFMDSSLNGELYVADIDDIDISDIPNWNDIKRWYRRFGINIICYIINNNSQDYEVFEEWYKYDYKLFIGLAERDEDGNIEEWIAESNFIIEDYI
jgi:hypothetical protein